MDENELMLLGKGSAIFMMSLSIVYFCNGFQTTNQRFGVTALFIGMTALIFWAIPGVLPFYALALIGGAAYCAASEMINVMHRELRPDESDTRRRVYVAVQIGVSLFALWFFGQLAGIDWHQFLASKE